MAKHHGKRYNTRKTLIKFRCIKTLRRARIEQSQIVSSGVITLATDVPSCTTPLARSTQTLALSITTAGRDGSTLLRSIANIRRVGFTQPLHVFAEPNAVSDRLISAADDNAVIHRHARQHGCYKNWRFSMEWMHANTDSDWVLAMQDDVIWCWRAPTILQYALETVDKDQVGFLSPYVSPAMVPPRASRLRHCWVRCQRRNFWGAVAMCYPRASLAYTVQSKRFREHTHFRQVDVVAGDVFYQCKDQRWPYIHLPSLADHIGSKSTIGRDKNPQNQWARHGFRFNADYTPRI